MGRIVGPSLFYGAAVAAAAGLMLGAALHGPWQSIGFSGPRILFSQAEAAEVAPPPPVAQVADSDPATAYAGYEPPDPLPVTRLDPDRFAPAADSQGRESADDALGDAAAAVAPTQAPAAP